MRSVIITVMVLLGTAGISGQDKDPIDAGQKVLELERTVAALSQQISQLQKIQAQPRETPEDTRKRRKQEAKAACESWGLRLDRVSITGTTATVVCK